MTYGLEVRNNNGGRVLTDSEKLMKLHKEGSFSGGDLYDETADISFGPFLPDEPVIVCVQPGNNLVIPQGFTRDSNNNITGFSIHTFGKTMNYKVFIRYNRNQSPSSGWGLHIFDANGDLVYDSNVIEGRVFDIFSVPSKDVEDIFNAGSINVSHKDKPGAFYAVSMFPQAFAAATNSNNTGSDFVHKGFRQAGGTTFQLDTYDDFTNFLANVDDTPYGSTMMILDDNGF